jgi:hypothetical protein
LPSVESLSRLVSRLIDLRFLRSRPVGRMKLMHPRQERDGDARRKLATRSAVFVPLLRLAQAANSMPLGRERPRKNVIGGMCSFVTGALPQ